MILKTLFVFLFLLCFYYCTYSQGKYYTDKGFISFFSEAPIEDIEAENNNIQAILDTKSGELLFIVPIKSFIFDKEMMQEHFNEQYLESNKYPEARFEGVINEFNIEMFKKSVNNNIIVSGDLTIHGVKQPISVEGNIQFQDNRISAKSTFNIQLKDYDIKIPTIVVRNIAEVVQVDVKVNLQEITQ